VTSRRRRLETSPLDAREQSAHEACPEERDDEQPFERTAAAVRIDAEDELDPLARDEGDERQQKAGRCKHGADPEPA